MATSKTHLEFKKVLQAQGCWVPFDALPTSHQREYLDWIEAAKRADTRQRRMCKAVEMLRAQAK